MRKRIRAAAFLAAVLFIVSGCGSAQSRWSWQEQEKTGTENTNRRLTDAELKEREELLATYGTFLDGIGEVTLLGDGEYYHSGFDYRDGYGGRGFAE